MFVDGRLYGDTVPRLWTKPLVTGPPGPCGCGCALTPATSRGFQAAEFAEVVCGIRLFPWQRWILIHALEILASGIYRYRTVLLLVARQNGKTSLVEIKNLFKLFVEEVPLIVGTAQTLDIAEESWDRALEVIEGTEELAAELDTVCRVNGKKNFRLSSGARWKITAKGRGLAGDDVNLDELREHHDFTAWSALSKTTMAIPGAQVWCFSNAGDDESVVLNDLQARGRAAAKLPEGSGGSIGHFEYSVPDFVTCTCGRPELHKVDCQLRDRTLWAMANPSMNHGTITEEAIEAALESDPVATFLTEVLCQRVQSLREFWRVVPEAIWAGQKAARARPGWDPGGLDSGPIYLSAMVTDDRSRAFVAGAWTVRGHTYVSIIDTREGIGWVPGRMAELVVKYSAARVVVPDKGPTASLCALLKDAGLPAAPPRTPDRPDGPPRRPAPALRPGTLWHPWAQDTVAAFQTFVDGLSEGSVWHFAEDPLTDAVKDGDTRSLGTGKTWAYDGDTDPAPAVAATLAVWASQTWRAPVERRSAYEDSDLTTV